ncbi:hypothetical protein ACWCW2_17160 [Streptomyces sp. NPDC001773]
MDGSTTWRDVEDLRPTATLPMLPVLREVPDGKGREHVFRHGGEVYRTRGQWDDGSGPWRAEHVSPDGRRMRVLNDQPNAEAVRSAVASMVTAVRITSGDRPVHYIADARNRQGDELRLDVPTADEHGRIREASEEDVTRRLAGVTKGVRRLRTGDERRETIAFLKVYLVSTDGWIGQPQFAHL